MSKSDRAKLMKSIQAKCAMLDEKRLAEVEQYLSDHWPEWFAQMAAEELDAPPISVVFRKPITE